MGQYGDSGSSIKLWGGFGESWKGLCFLEQKILLVKMICIYKAERLSDISLLLSDLCRRLSEHTKHILFLKLSCDLIFVFSSLGMKKLIWKLAFWSPEETQSLWRMSTPFT